MSSISATSDFKIYSIFNNIESGYYSRALNEVNKCLRKNKDEETLQCLKALILLRTGKTGEAKLIVDELLRNMPTEETSITVLITFLTESKQNAKLDKFLDDAIAKFPGRIELHKGKFFRSICKMEHGNLQALVKPITQLDPKLNFWMIISLIMQSRLKDIPNPSVYLKLAEKFMKRSIESNSFNSHNQLNVYIQSLKELGDYKGALEFIEENQILPLINKNDYEYDHSGNKISLSLSLNDWDRVIRYSKESLAVDVDDWTAWSAISNMVFTRDAESGTLQVTSQERLDVLTQTLVETSSDAKKKRSRGYLLASMDYLVNLNLANLPVPSAFESLEQCLERYFQIYGNKEICATDTCQLISIGFGKEEAFELCSKIKSDALLKFKESKLKNKKEEISCTEVVNILRIIRFLGYEMDFEEIFNVLFQVNPLLTGSYNDDFEEVYTIAEKTKNVANFDGLLHITCFELFNNKKDDSSIQSLLLAYHWLNTISLKYSPYDHHSKILLMKLLSPMGGLSAARLQLNLNNAIRTKLSLSMTIGHLVANQSTLLTSWATYQSAISSANDPGISQSLNTSRISTNPISSSDLTNKTNSTRNRRNKDFRVHIDEYYAKLRTFRDNMIKDAEDAVVNAFNSESFAQIEDILQLLERIRNSNVFLTAITETSFWRSIILPHNFDQLLEEMTNILEDNDLISKHLPTLSDLRDIDVVPTFERERKLTETKEESFNQLKSWLKLRNIPNILFGQVIIPFCLNVIKSMSNCEHGSDDNHSTTVNTCISMLQTSLKDLESENPPSPILKDANSMKKHQKTISGKRLLSNDPVTSSDQLHLYLYGPFGQVLKLLLDVFQEMQLIITNENSEKSMERLKVIFVEMRQLFDSDMSPIWKHASEIKEDDFIADIPAYIANSTMITETFSLLALFVSSIVSIIRPITIMKKPTKPNKAKAKSGSTEKCPYFRNIEEVVSLLNENLILPLIKSDKSEIVNFQRRLQRFHLKLVDTSDTSLVETLIAMSRSYGESIFSKNLIDKYPIIVPNKEEKMCRAAYRVLAENWIFAFDQLSSCLTTKMAHLINAYDSELSIYLAGAQMDSLLAKR